MGLLHFVRDHIPVHIHGGADVTVAHQFFIGILFVLRSGIPWEMLPQEMGCGSGMSYWRRLRDWRQLPFGN
jgi:hypothetical protein